MLKLSVCCCTYNRPHLLGELIESFQMQTYPKSHCELVILDDGGQYGNVRGENWQIISFHRRFASLGEKRNACVSLTSHESEYFVVADDDDIYLPWWLECHAKIFEHGALWSSASSAFWSEKNQIVGQWNYHDEGSIMHPTHAFHKKTFWDLGGYPHLAWLEDHELFEKFRAAGIDRKDALLGENHEKQMPYLVYRWNLMCNHNHTTGVSLEQYRINNMTDLLPIPIEIGWKKDYLAEAKAYLRTQTKSNQF